ncbi:MAG: lipid-A-disaccharide synthase, partial [Gammaproteobacteria bacterium]|nr:lipid-A-disaccharide synthase [Gammaproteobacteria bacterium]
MPRIVIVAGEISGDRLGAGLIRAVQERRPDVRFAGIGGPAMEAAGCDVWVPSEELAVMGLAEVVRHLPRLRRTLKDLERRLLADPPDLYIGIDAPDFNLRVERRMRAAGLQTVHYVSPSVWAWRPGRVRVLREACDHVLCLLPFEADFLHRHNVAATFVGHPLADDLPASPSPASSRQALGLPAARPVLAVLPGSRAGELERLGPVFAETMAWLGARVPGLTVVVPMATPALRDRFAGLFAPAITGGVKLQIIDGQAHTAMAAADVVLLTSGTATLEAMLINRPMVVAYILAPLTYTVLKALRLIRLEHFALPNILAGERLVPEFLQSEASPAALGAAVLRWLESPADRERLSQRFDALGTALRCQASECAAEVVLGMLEHSYNQ